MKTLIQYKTVMHGDDVWVDPNLVTTVSTSKWFSNEVDAGTTITFVGGGSVRVTELAVRVVDQIRAQG